MTLWRDYSCTRRRGCGVSFVYTYSSEHAMRSRSVSGSQARTQRSILRSIQQISAATRGNASWWRSVKCGIGSTFDKVIAVP